MARRRHSRAERDLELWKTWKADESEETLEPLLDALQPLIRKKVNEFSTAPVPPAAVHGMANTLALKALRTYNPKKGAAVGTYVDWHLRKVRSFVIKHQNVGRIPDHRAHNIGRYKAAKDELTERLGHAPDALTMAEHLGPKWSLAEVGRMESELRPDLIASKNVETDMLPELQSSREREVLRYIYQELAPDERSVFEYTMGVNGKPKLSASQIAITMGVSQPKVSRIRRKIDNKLRARGI